MSLTLRVKQDDVEAELSMPTETLISSFGEVWLAWPHKEKFVLSWDERHKMVLEVDGVDIPWEQVAEHTAKTEALAGTHVARALDRQAAELV